MIAFILIFALLLQPTPDPQAAVTEPTLAAVRAADGVYVSWISPEYGCVRLTGINLDDMIACGYTGNVRLDAGQSQYAGVGRLVGLWGGSEWLAAPISLPGYIQVLPIVAAPGE